MRLQGPGVLLFGGMAHVVGDVGVRQSFFQCARTTRPCAVPPATTRSGPPALRTRMYVIASSAAPDTKNRPL